jgi:trigger factor
VRAKAVIEADIMQISESSISGLKRELKVIILQGELGERFATRLGEFKDQVQIRGFRKGKVPVAHLKKLYGRSVMAEVMQQAVEETSRKAIEERKERAAHQPNINLTEDKEELERVLAGQSDLAFTLSYEALPDIVVTDLAALKLERPLAEVTEEAIDKGVASLAERATRYEAEPERAAGMGDRLTIDFLGRIGGEEFAGGKGEDVQMIVGESRFIPGFVEGLMDAKAGEERIINATFPEDYPQAQLAGKDAVFTVKVKEVAKAIKPQLDDEFAKTLGAESLAKLRELVGARIAAEYMMHTRMKLKRQILDALDTAHDFALPETLVNTEFDAIWKQLQQGLERANRTLADEGKEEATLRAQYHKIAERRVRLGLLIGEIGDKAKVEVAQDELRRALIEQARRYPGQEKLVYEYYEKNPTALLELRAPIFEDKVIEHILSHAKPIDRQVTVEELLKPDDDEEAFLPVGHTADHDPIHDHAHAHGHAHDHDDHDHDHDHDHGHGHDHHDHDHHDHDHHDHDHHGHDHDGQPPEHGQGGGQEHDEGPDHPPRAGQEPGKS